MAFVAINVLTVPGGRGEVLEQRFAGRAGAVDSAAGFEHFELLRPVEGTQDYLVYTRWRSREDFEAWTSSQAFGRGHAGASGRPDGQAPAATGSTVWQFETAQSADADTDADRA
jgi:heme oxygenase (mycobilin-producing)